MRIRVLGGFEVEGVSERRLGSRKGRTLLKLLALARGRPVPVDRAAEVVWEGRPPDRPGDHVGVLVSRLRGVLGAERIVRRDEGYALLADWLDVDELDVLADTAAGALADGRVGVARAATRAALDLARGPLLEDEDGDWVEADRAAVAAATTRVRRIAVDAAMAAGDHDGAVAAAEQALAADPYDEAVLRSLMEAHLAARRPASALAAYGRVRRRLSDDLGVSPTGETEAVYLRALAAADAPPGAPATMSDRGAPLLLVGRAEQATVLDHALAAAIAGDVVVVAVEGEAGIGKTALVDAWSARVAERATVLRSACDVLGRDLPLQPVVDALVVQLRMMSVEAGGELLGADGPALAPLLGPTAGSAATFVADTEAGRVRLFTALLNVVLRMRADGPLVLVVDDLHLAGPATMAWLSFARRRGHHLMIVTTSRAGSTGLDPSHVLRLGPLDREAVAELVGPDRVDALYERSGGHPLLLGALAASRDDELPAGLRDAVAAEIDSLGADVAATVRLAAVLGDCDISLLGQVGGRPAVTVLDHLEAAAAAGVLIERESTFAFRHDLVREAVEAGTGAARRALVHQLAAKALAMAPRPDPLSVAVHARAGGDLELAAEWFLAAANEAAARFDTAAAEAHLAASIDLSPSASAYTARARLRIASGHLDRAAADAERAVALGGAGRALEVAGWVAYYRRRHDEAAAFAEAAAIRSGGEDDDVRTSALALAGRVRHGAGDLDGAVERLEQVVGTSPSVQGVADVWLAGARVHQGRPHDALTALARPSVAPEELAHPFAPMHLWLYRAMALGQLGRVGTALNVLADVDGLLARSGPAGVRFQGALANTAAWILRWSGDLDAADDANRRAYELTGGDGGPSADAMTESHYVSLLDLADGAWVRDDLAAMAAFLDRLAPVDRWEGTMAWHQRHRLGLLRAKAALATGDHDLAAEFAAAVMDDARNRGAARYEALAGVVLALVDDAVTEDRVAPAVAAVGRSAVLDGWPLLARLAAVRGHDGWHREAERLAASVVAASGERRDRAGRFADRLLAGR